MAMNGHVVTNGHNGTHPMDLLMRPPSNTSTFQSRPSAPEATVTSAAATVVHVNGSDNAKEVANGGRTTDVLLKAAEVVENECKQKAKG